MSDRYDSITQPLRNGDSIPTHPSDTTAKKITILGPVFDAADNTELTAGIHRNEISRLMAGDQMTLKHLYRYAILDRKIYHTRPTVIIKCVTEPIAEVVE